MDSTYPHSTALAAVEGEGGGRSLLETLREEQRIIEDQMALELSLYGSLAPEATTTSVSDGVHHFHNGAPPQHSGDTTVGGCGPLPFQSASDTYGSEEATRTRAAAEAINARYGFVASSAALGSTSGLNNSSDAFQQMPAPQRHGHRSASSAAARVGGYASSSGRPPRSSSSSTLASRNVNIRKAYADPHSAPIGGGAMCAPRPDAASSTVIDRQQLQRSLQASRMSALKNYFNAMTAFPNYEERRRKLIGEGLVKPFSFELREAMKPKSARQRRLEEDRNEAALAEIASYEEGCFRAHPVPPSTFLNKYELMVQEWCARKEAIRMLAEEKANKIKKDNAALYRYANSFNEAKGRAERANLERKREEEKRFQQFKARDVPADIRDTKWPSLAEQEMDRRRRIQVRAEALLAASHRPPRMEAAHKRAAAEANGTLYLNTTGAVSLSEPHTQFYKHQQQQRGTPLPFNPPAVQIPVASQATSTSLANANIATGAPLSGFGGAGIVGHELALSSNPLGAREDPNAIGTTAPHHLTAPPAAGVSASNFLPCCPDEAHEGSDWVCLCECHRRTQHARKLEEARRDLSLHNPNFTFRPTVRADVPDFEFQWAKDRLAIAKRRSQKTLTQPQAFNLAPARDTRERTIRTIETDRILRESKVLNKTILPGGGRVLVAPRASSASRAHSSRMAGRCLSAPHTGAPAASSSAQQPTTAAVDLPEGFMTKEAYEAAYQEALARAYTTADDGTVLFEPRAARPAGTRAHMMQCEAAYQRLDQRRREAELSAAHDEIARQRQQAVNKRVQQFLPPAAASQRANARQIEEKRRQFESQSTEANRRLNDMKRTVASRPPIFVEPVGFTDMIKARATAADEVMKLLRETGLHQRTLDEVGSHPEGGGSSAAMAIETGNSQTQQRVEIIRAVDAANDSATSSKASSRSHSSASSSSSRSSSSSSRSSSSSSSSSSAASKPAGNAALAPQDTKPSESTSEQKRDVAPAASSSSSSSSSSAASSRRSSRTSSL